MDTQQKAKLQQAISLLQSLMGGKADDTVGATQLHIPNFA